MSEIDKSVDTPSHSTRDTINAARTVLERTLGKPLEADILERLENLESIIEGQKQHANN